MATLKNTRDINLQATASRIMLDIFDGITVNISNGTTVVKSDNLGVVTDFTNTGTTITVNKLGTSFNYASSGQYTFDITATPSVSPVGGVTLGTKTGSGTSCTFANITAMSSSDNVVVVTYAINIRGESGLTHNPYYITQTFTKVGMGANGSRTAILDLYKWSASAPITFPSGTSTYTWATGQFTNPGTLNGWSATPGSPVLGETLWIARTLYVDALTTLTSSVTWSTSTAIPLTGAGVNGTRTAFLEVYQWAASAPGSFPSGTSTYTWATGAFTAPSVANGWSLTPGSPTPGYNLYACSVSFADSLTTATSVVTWNTVTAYIVGAAGLNGTVGPAGAAGDVAVFAYCVLTSTSLPSSPTISLHAVPTATPAVAFTPPTYNWYTQPKGTLATNEWQFQIAGTKTVGGVYTWESSLTGYLSTFKVGKLEALSVETGNLQMTAAGYIRSGTKAYGSGDGYFLGYDSGYKFDITAGTKYLRFDASAGTLLFGGDIETEGRIIGNATYSSGIWKAAIIGNPAQYFNSGVLGYGYGTVSGITQTGIRGIGYNGAYGGYFYSESTSAVYAQTGNVTAGYSAIYGYNGGAGYGVRGLSVSGAGIYGTSTDSYGVQGTSTNSIGVYGTSSVNYGVYGTTNSGVGVYGVSNTTGVAVKGIATDPAAIGIYGTNTTGVAVKGTTTSSGTGIYGSSATGYAGDFTGGLGLRVTGPIVLGATGNSITSSGQFSASGAAGYYVAVTTTGSNPGVYATSTSTGHSIYSAATVGYAGYFSGGKGILSDTTMTVTGSTFTSTTGLEFGYVSSATATAGTGGALPAQVRAYIVIQFAGIPMKIPVYNT